MTYSYLYNLQGDVIGLVDSAGSLVVEYKYNAWGSIIGRAGSLAETLGKLNPFRYRGYVYDEETWMYWLKSRYYYPELSRFISADVVMGKVGSVNGHNLHAYCGNEPVACSDRTGCTPESIEKKRLLEEHYANVTGYDEFIPRIYGIGGDKYVKYEITNYDVRSHTVGEEISWLQSVMGFLATEGMSTIVTCALWTMKIQVDPERVSQIFDGISGASTGLDAYMNTFSHTYYENTVQVDVEYASGSRGSLIYTFYTCDEEGCRHYDGVHVYGSIWYGWIFPARVSETYYPQRYIEVK